MRHAIHGLLFAATAALAAGCFAPDESLFPPPIDGVPGIVHLGELVPAVVANADDVRGATIYAELGPTGSTEYGGATFSFTGTGRSVCVWVDPELVSWSQAISTSTNAPRYTAPDNVFDDGDLDISGGLTVYYSGVPGQSVGTFEVAYQDSLGNEAFIALVECSIFSDQTNTFNGAAGRGIPEYCTIPNTTVGVSYTAVLETYSVPLDDNRLAYGLIVSDGDCADLKNAGIGLGDTTAAPGDECLITGEALVAGEPAPEKTAVDGTVTRYWTADEKTSWPGSEDFEAAFCDVASATALVDFCNEERRTVRQAEQVCSWEDAVDEEAGKVRCFCGDPLDNPRNGSF